MFSYKKGDEYEIGIPLTLPIFFIGKKNLNAGITTFRSSCPGAAETNPNGNYEVVDSIPGLSQWV